MSLVEYHPKPVVLEDGWVLALKFTSNLPVSSDNHIIVFYAPVRNILALPSVESKNADTTLLREPVDLLVSLIDETQRYNYKSICDLLRMIFLTLPRSHPSKKMILRNHIFVTWFAVNVSEGSLLILRSWFLWSLFKFHCSWSKFVC